MPDADPRTIRLADYAPFPWTVEGVELTFALAPRGTRVTSRVRFAPRPGASGPFVLHGEDLALIDARTAMAITISQASVPCGVVSGGFQSSTQLSAIGSAEP